MRPEQTIETFPDGVVDIYAENGRKLGEKKIHLRFEEKTVGVNRFYQQQASVMTGRIDRVIKVQHTKIISTLDIAVVKEDGRQYRILRIQEKPEKGVDLLELQSVTVAIDKEVTKRED